LKTGDIVDASDKYNIWYTATILDTRKAEGDRDVTEALIGFRVYIENGKKIDKKGKLFNGWSEKYDEWISVTSPRIQKCKKIKRCFEDIVCTKKEDVFIDDSKDDEKAAEG
jgi:hypothetical protein